MQQSLFYSTVVTCFGPLWLDVADGIAALLPSLGPISVRKQYYSVHRVHKYCKEIAHN